MAVKNCGPNMARAACSHSMMHYMKRLIKKYMGKKAGYGMTNPVGGLAAQMLQLWATSFDPRHLPYYGEAYRRLLSKGIRFPTPGDGFKEQIVYRAHPPKSTSSSKPKLSTSNPTSPSRSNSGALPSSVISTLDTIGEFLGFVFSITEDPNVPLPEDLLKPSMQSLEEHSKKVAELVDANIGNEEAVRRLLEVNDQLDAASKRLNGHRNIIDAEDDDDSSSESDEHYKKSKAKSSKSKSAPNVADAAVSSKKKPKVRHSSVTKTSSVTSSSTNDLLVFDAPAPTSVHHSTPATTFDAFDFTHTGSAFAPASNAGWASFEVTPGTNNAASNGQNDFAARSSSTPHMMPAYNGAPAYNGNASNGSLFGGFDYRMSPPTSYTSPAPAPTTSAAPQAVQPPNAFNPFSFDLSPSVSTAPAAHAPAVVHTTAPANNNTINNFAPFTPQNTAHTSAAAYSSPVSSPPPSNTQASQRVAGTFGKYWANPETAPAPSTPTSSTYNYADPFNPAPTSPSNVYSSPASPNGSGYAGSPVMAYKPAPVPATSNNPFL